MIAVTERTISWISAGTFVVVMYGLYRLLCFIQNRQAKRRALNELSRQAVDHAFVHSKPLAYVLDVVDNGLSGWKWLVWDYDPDKRRLMSGQVEGVLVPRGMRGGYLNENDALLAGIDAIRLGDWDGDILFRQTKL